MKDASTLLAVDGLVQGYGDKHVLQGVSLRMARGTTTLLGVNGAGKTTLMRTLVGELRPRSGTIRWAVDGGSGAPLSGHAFDVAARRRTGYLPQDPRLPERMRLRDLVAYAAWLKLVPRQETRDAVHEALRRVDLLDRLDDRVGTLSGGMRQRAALATAIVHDPELLVLDEPTAGLDPQQRIKIRRLIASLGQRRCVLISTHVLQDAVHLGGNLAVLHRGAVIFRGTVADLEALAVGSGDAMADSPAERGFLRLLADADAPLAASR